jgi:Zn-dependent protease
MWNPGFPSSLLPPADRGYILCLTGRTVMYREDKPLFQFRLFRVPVKFHASALLNFVFALFYLFSPMRMLIAFGAVLLVIIVHELGHACLVRLCGYRVDAVHVQFAGGTCEHEECEFERHDILIAWGGVFAQLAIALLAVAAFIVFNPFFSRSDFASACFLILMYQNTFSIVYNLLPIQGFDGRTAWRFVKRGNRTHRFLAGLHERRKPAARAVKPGRRVSAEAKAFANKVFEEMKRHQDGKSDGD